MCRIFRRNIILCYASLLLLALSSALSEHNLGDSVTSKQSESDLFADIDINGNGRISEAELYEFVQETGGDSLDESKEVHNAVSSVMSVLDGNNDKILKKDDLSKYMKSLASLLPLDEVARWVAHAQQMPPDVVKSFMDNGITGYDFPELLQNDGALLEQELGISRVSLRRRLMRGMRMKLLGMGNHPAAPELLTLTSLPPTLSATAATSVLPEGKVGGDRDHCEQATALIQWGSGNSRLPDFLGSNDMDFPVHKYQLYREHGPGVGGSSDPVVQQRTLAGKDELIYEGMEMFFKDRLPVRPSRADSVTYTYRLVAWNVIGRSEYTVFEHTVPQLSRRCLEVLADVAPAPLQLSLPHMGQRQNGDDNASHDVAVPDRSDAAVGARRSQEANTITPSPPDGVSELGVGPSSPAVVVVAVNKLLHVLTTASSVLALLYYSVKYTVLAMSFLLSFVFTVMRVKSLLMYNKAIEREGAVADSVTDAVLGYVTFLEPACGWLQRTLLVPSLSWVAPVLSRLLDALGAASPACRPMTNHLANAMGLVVKMVLEPWSGEGDSSGQAVTAAPRRDSAGCGSSRHPPGLVLRNQDSVSNMSCSSDDVSNSESMEVSFHQCYLCAAPVTDKLMKKGKRKRHHCSRCGGIFCKKCGTVDHVALQCQVGGKCVCRRCQSSAGAAVAGRVDARRSGVSAGAGVGVGKSDIRDLSSLDIFIDANNSSGGKASQGGSGGGSKQDSNASSRSNSPVPELTRFGNADSESSSVSRSTPPVSTPEALRGRPPLHTSAGSVEKVTTRRSTFTRISMNILGIRHKSPSPPLDAPALYHQGSTPHLPPFSSSSSLGSLEPPDMVRSATYS